MATSRSGAGSTLNPLRVLTAHLLITAVAADQSASPWPIRAVDTWEQNPATSVQVADAGCVAPTGVYVS
jgi:hypothetical protein